MRSQLRKTGLDVLGDVRWGAHLCLFYETKQDLLDTIVPYFKAGLENNEFCLWAISEILTVEEAGAGLSQAIPNFKKYVAAGSIQMAPAKDWHIGGSESDLEQVAAEWRDKRRHALKHGYDGVRANGNAFWFPLKHRKALTEYESELDQALKGQTMIVLCTYALRASEAVDIMDAVRAHKFTAARRKGEWEIIESPKRAERPTNAATAGATAAIAALTAREREVLALIVAGVKNREIAARLGISQRTIEVYRTRILLKTRAKNLPDLVRMAIIGGIDERRR